MKFTIAVVLLALAVSAQSSVIPLGWGSPLSYTEQHVDVHHHGLIGAHHGLVGVHHGLVGAHHGWVDAHHGLVDAHHAHGLVGIPAAVVAGHGLVSHGHGIDLVHGHHHNIVAHHAHHVPAVVAHAHIPHIAHEGTYVAANRGSVHVAPLAGHIQSASSVNLQPAPGTL